jgi:hypothetical protein
MIAIAFVVFNVALFGMMIVRLFKRPYAQGLGDISRRHSSRLIYVSILFFAANVLAMFVGLHFIPSPKVLVLDDVSLATSWAAVGCGFFGRGRARGVTLFGSTVVAMCWSIFVCFIH